VRPYSPPSRYFLLLLPLLSIALAAWLWGLLADQVSLGGYDYQTFLCGLAFFLALVLLGMSVYLAWCAFTISYKLDSSKLTMRCGGVRQVIPLSAIEEVYAPGALIDSKAITVRWSGLVDIMPGYLVGTGTSPQIGRVISVATRPAFGQIFLVTSGVSFGLSPAHPSEFIQQLNRRRELQLEFASSHITAPHTELRGISGLAAPLWADKVVRTLMLAGLFLCALLFGYISLIYNGLPISLPLHWNPQAQVDVIGDPQELLRLPAFALAIWLVNVILAAWALRRERAATLFLLAGAVAAQIVFTAGALSIILRAS
jgi:hypothetical protein